MKSKIPFFICLIVFVITNVRCGVDAIDSPPIPMIPTERINGVFQFNSTIISLNDDGEYMMVGSITGGRYLTGQYNINQFDILELNGTIPNNVYSLFIFHIQRESLSRQVSSLILLDRTSFDRILSEDEYNRPILVGSNTLYRGIGPNGQGYSLNLSLYRFRIAEFTHPNTSIRTYGAYYFTQNSLVFSISRTSSMNFAIERNTTGEFSSFRYQAIPFIRENVFVYTTDELTVLANNIVGERFQIFLRDGRSYDFVFDRPIMCPFFIEGESVLRVNLQIFLEKFLEDHNINYNPIQLTFIVEIRAGSRTEIISFSPLSSDCPILKITKMPHDEL